MSTIQTTMVKRVLAELGHASNYEVHARVIEQLPDFALPSLHRITSRLIEKGEIGTAPSDGRKVILDHNPHSHSHFVCSECGGVKDIDLSPSVVEDIQSQLDGIVIKDSLVICGLCTNCQDS